MPKPKTPPKKVALYTDLMPKELREALLDYLDRLEFPTGPEVEYEVIREEEKAALDPRFLRSVKDESGAAKKGLVKFIKKEANRRREELGERMQRYGPVRAAVAKKPRPKRDSKKERVDFVELEKVKLYKK